MSGDRAWRRYADAVAALGAAVVVFDPEALLPLEELWDGDPAHGVISILQLPGITGWEIHVREELAEVDSETMELLETLEDTVGEEDDGTPD